MKILIIGARGQLGSDLCQVFPEDELIPLEQTDMEITDMDSVQKALLKHQPEIVINTAAFVRVDDCESEKDKAFSVNALGARNVAVVCQKIGAKLVFLSTDYVFGGGTQTAGIPYHEFDIPVPLSIYGASKLAGEKMVCHLCQKYFIVRTSGLFGVAGSLGKGGNFVETILKLAKTKNELTVVNDQVFSPTSAKDLARKIAQISKTEFYGIFHITNSGFCSWFEFSREIVKLAGLKTPVIPVTTDQYPQKAKRPNYSVLQNYHLHLLGLDDMRPWQEALADYMQKKDYTK
jgi:dTDP-4-dehydrorhamnose reductase